MNILINFVFIMDRIPAFSKSVEFEFNHKKEFVLLKLKAISKKVDKLFNSSEKEIEIFHLGGTKNPTFDPINGGCKLDTKEYFYERVPVKTKDGEIHTYGKELKKYVEEWMKEIREEKTEDNFQKWIEKKTEGLEIEEEFKTHSVRYFVTIHHPLFT